MNDDQYFLANAYLDGELTDGERQLAEADPDVMSAVDRLRSMQSRLRAAEPPSPAARSAALAAAMAEFAPMPADNPEVRHERVVVPLASRRPTYGRYLGIAAAAVAIGAVGTVVAGQLGGSDDDSSDMTSQESSETFAQNTIAAEARAAEGDASATTAAASDALSATAVDEMADAEIAGSAPTDDQALAVEASSEDPAAATIAAAAMPYPTTGGPIEPLADRDQTLTSPGELAGLGVLLAGLRDAGELGATPETRCVFDDPLLEIVDTARYQFADFTSTVLVAIIDDGIDGHTAAIDPDTCIVLVVGP